MHLMKIKFPSYISWKSQNKKKKKKKKKEKKIRVKELRKFLFNKIFELRNSVFFYFYFFILKVPSYEKLAITSEFKLTRFYDVISNNSVF